MKKLLSIITLLSGIYSYQIQSMQIQGPANQNLMAGRQNYMDNWMQQHNITNITPEQTLEMIVQSENDPQIIALENAATEENVRSIIPNQLAATHIITTPNLFEGFKLAFKIFSILGTLNNILLLQQSGTSAAQSFISNVTAELNYRRTVQYRENFDAINRNYHALLKYLQDSFPNEQWAQRIITFLQQEIRQYLNPIEYSLG